MSSSSPARSDRDGPRLAVRVRRVEGPPVVAVRAWLRGGARVERVPGQALIAGRLLAEGSRRRGWRAIAEEVESRGADLNAFGTFEVTGLSIDALAGDWRQAVDWAAELVLEPSHPADRCAWLTRQAAGELEALMDQPEARAGWAFQRHLYAPHPRGRPLQGDAASLSRLGRRDCVEFHRQAVARGVIVSVAGEVDEPAVRRRVEERFAAVAGAASPPAEPPAPEGLTAPRQELPVPGAEQAYLYAGHLTVQLTDPDLPALELLGVVLGSGPGLAGRIPHRLRDREGLGYSVEAGAAVGAGLDPGHLYAGIGTAVASVPRAEAAIREELERLRAEGPTRREVEEARSYRLGREPFRRETARQWAALMARAELYGLPLDDPDWSAERWRALTPEAVAAAARRHLHPERLKVTVCRPG